MRLSWNRPLFALLAFLLAGTAVAPAQPPSPLVKAIERNDYATVAAIVKKGTKPGEVNEALFYAAGYKAGPKIVTLLLAHGADVTFKLSTNHATPLHYAAMNNTPAVVALLLKRGANVDATDQDLNTPIDWAAGMKNIPTIKYLLQHGANGPDALVNQTYEKNTDGVTALLDAGVDVNARSGREGFEGETALIEAASGNDMALARLLLERGADVNAVQPGDRYNMTTALMFAAYHCNSDMIALLASHGARDDVQANGRDAYDLAQTGWTSTMQPCDSGILSQLSALH